jgi:stage III sporulation protein AC
MEILFKIAAVGILTAVINNILEKSDKKEIATLVTLAGLVIVLLMVVDMISGLFDTLKSMFNLYLINNPSLFPFPFSLFPSNYPSLLPALCSLLPNLGLL